MREASWVRNVTQEQGFADEDVHPIGDMVIYIQTVGRKDHSKQRELPVPKSLDKELL